MKKISKNSLYKNIRTVLEQARSISYRAVNVTMIQAYWEVGRLIVEDEQHGKRKAAYGEEVLSELSEKLTADFGKGFDERNLRNMRLFYQTFPIRNALRSKSSVKKLSIWNALRSELSWTHYRLLLRVKNDDARNYYMHECANQNWSSRALELQINSHYYERILSSKNTKPVRKEAITKTKQLAVHVHDFIKDPFVLEFLDLKQNPAYLEKDLEQGLIDNLQSFLLELGKGFSFVARQYRMSVGDEHFYIDLVFYNFILKCFVLIDLKLGKLTHQDIGQMDMYVRMFEDTIKNKSDNPTIGIVLCSEKNETVAHYSVLKENKHLFASKYLLYLPSEKEFVKQLKHELQNLKRKE